MTTRSLRLLATTALPALAVLVAAAPAAAQPSTTPPDEPIETEQPADDGAELIVTGTRRADRTQADSTVPIDVISGEALTDTGFTEVNRILNQLVPSFNFPQPSITDGTDVLRPATLRGLAPDQTLVLVNGKRRHPSALLNINGSVGRGSAAVDLNTIPTLAIERIEVLRDGASSQYGSDAIAGVINVQLRRSPGGRAQLTYGQYITRIDEVPELTGIARQANGEPQIDADGNFVRQLGEDREAEDGATITAAVTYGIAIGDAGHINVTGEYRDREFTNRAGFDPRRQYPLVAGLSDPREFTADRLNHRYGDAATQDYNLFVNAGYEISPEIELYAFGSYGNREGESAGFFRRANDARNRNFSASTTTFVPFYADGFLPLIRSEIIDYSIAAGVRGALLGWNYDLSWVHGGNSFDFGVDNSFNTSFGAASQRSFDAGGLRFRQHVANLDIQREVTPGLSIALGVEYRRENFEIVPGELQSYAGGPFAAAPFNAPAGAQVFPGFQPANATDATRESMGAYFEAEADIIPDMLTVQVASRFEHFTDFGDTLDGKVAARFAPVEWFAVRGSASTGFRAPSLHQQFYSTISTNNVNGVLLEILTVPVSSPIARALGSQPLDPERSTNLSVGATLTPGNGINVTIDYYKINLDDRIVVTENLQGAAVVALLRGAGFNNVSSARFFINGIDTTTEGFDVVGTWRLRDTGLGDFTFTAGYNYNETSIGGRAVLPTLPGLTLFGRVESIRIEEGQPKDKINLGVDWDYDIFGAMVRANRYGEVLVGATNPLADERLGTEWVVDAELRVKLFDRIQLAVGANNLFDEYPDALTPGGVFGSNPYFIPFSQASPFGFNGRFLYGRVAVEF